MSDRYPDPMTGVRTVPSRRKVRDIEAETRLVRAIIAAANRRCDRCGSRRHVARECPSDLFDTE